MSRLGFRSIVGTLGVVLLGAPAVARAAPDVDACASAYEEAQRRQGKGALLDAREQVATCADAACPKAIVSMCSVLAEDLDKTIPTVVVALVDAAGQDVAGARVVIDGKEPGVALDGRAMPLDPGAHRFKVVPAGAAVQPVEVEVTLLAGERNRRVEARLAAERAPARPPNARTDAKVGGSSLVVPAVVALSIGGVGVGVGAVTGALALGEDSSLADLCATETSCPPEEQDRIDRAGTFATVSTVGFVIGVVGVATGVVLLLVGGGEDDAGATSADARGLTVRF